MLLDPHFLGQEKKGSPHRDLIVIGLKSVGSAKKYITFCVYIANMYITYILIIVKKTTKSRNAKELQREGAKSWHMPTRAYYANAPNKASVTLTETASVTLICVTKSQQ